MAKQAEAAVADAPPEEEQPKKKIGKKKLLVFALLALLLIGGGAAGIIMATKKTPADTGEEATEAVEGETSESGGGEPAAQPVFLPLDQFVVNLRDDEYGDNYLQIGVVLEMTDEAAVEVTKLQMPRIRNAILLLLSSKTADNLATLEGKQQLMREIVEESRKQMPGTEAKKGIEGVYFSAFVIQ